MIKLNSEWNWNDIVIWRVAYWGKRKIETGDRNLRLPLAMSQCGGYGVLYVSGCL